MLAYHTEGKVCSRFGTHRAKKLTRTHAYVRLFCDECARAIVLIVVNNSFDFILSEPTHFIRD